MIIGVPKEIKDNENRVAAIPATVQALASRGQWKDWYRGDRKMNLERAEKQTREAVALLAQRQSSR